MLVTHTVDQQRAALGQILSWQLHVACLPILYYDHMAMAQPLKRDKTSDLPRARASLVHHQRCASKCMMVPEWILLEPHFVSNGRVTQCEQAITLVYTCHAHYCLPLPPP